MKPEPEELRLLDPHGDLWRRDNDACCRLRRISPLYKALKQFDAWITGRKGFQSGERTDLPMFEVVEGWIKINPLSKWTEDQIDDYFEAFSLPRHPLEEKGYKSVGCAPYTACVTRGQPPRSGRWPASPKSECGIHKHLTD